MRTTKPATRKPLHLLPRYNPNRAKPRWTGSQLVYRGRVIAELSSRSETRTKILQAFQDAGWRDRIDNPFDPRETADPKGRLRNIVRLLNAALAGGLRFYCDGCGIRWKRIRSA